MNRLATYAALLVGLSLATGCEQSDEAIFTELSIRLVMPDNRTPEQLLVSDQSGFFNINSAESVAFPAVTNNRAVARLRKGVYTFKIELRAIYAPGDTVALRNADHNQTTQAVSWIGDEESVVLILNKI